MATASQIRDKALSKLGLKAQGKVPTAAISDDVDNAYTEVYAELEELGLITWDADENVPDSHVSSLVALVAYARVDEYSVPNDRYTRIVNDQLRALPYIKQLQAGDDYQPVTS